MQKEPLQLSDIQSLLSKDNIDAKQFGIPTIKKFGNMSTGKFVKFVDIDDIAISDMFSTTSMNPRGISDLTNFSMEGENMIAMFITLAFVVRNFNVKPAISDLALHHR